MTADLNDSEATQAGMIGQSRGYKKCPCGATPENIGIASSATTCKWAFAYGDCCGEWNIEFRTGYNQVDSAECMKLAIEAWNEAPRQEPPNDG